VEIDSKKTECCPKDARYSDWSQEICDDNIGFKLQHRTHFPQDCNGCEVLTNGAISREVGLDGECILPAGGIDITTTEIGGNVVSSDHMEVTFFLSWILCSHPGSSFIS